MHRCNKKFWRKDNLRECICEIKKFTRVILTSYYGYTDFLWFSEICEQCMFIVGKIHDFYVE